jgi:hypothetical protein
LDKVTTIHDGNGKILFPASSGGPAGADMMMRNKGAIASRWGGPVKRSWNLETPKSQAQPEFILKYQELISPC